MRGRILGGLLAMSALAGCSGDRAEGTAGGGAASAGSGGVAGIAGNGGSSGGGSGSGGSSGNNAPSGPVPMFPGAGTSEDAKPLPGGMVCDSVGGATPPHVDQVTRCFFGPDDRENPAATIEQVLECVDGTTVLHLRLTFAPSFVDNTYGVNQIGWPGRRGHTFRDLVGSDHAELVLIDGDGDIAMQFKMDYISADPTAPSGYSALGVTGGDGAIEIGDAAHIIDASTSLDRNFNERGYDSYNVDSPATDENFTPNPDAPEWDYRVVFDVWVDLAAFGDAGFSGAFIEYVHASPSKSADDTIETTPDDCPPPWDACLDDNPDTYCGEQPPEDPCLDGNPDTYCYDPPVGCYDGDSETPCADPCGDDMPDTYCEEPPVGCYDGDSETPCADPCGDDKPDTYCNDPMPPVGCYDGDPGTPCADPCGDDKPDTYCGGGEPTDPNPPAYCERYPSDPACRPE